MPSAPQVFLVESAAAGYGDPAAATAARARDRDNGLSRQRRRTSTRDTERCEATK